ncbi:unannotated protein [freshwater metagenome]|uniref:shikimate kinase n=1 Tax=freshwater metagenome TaxID=449393 RepID=A0A6J7XQP7_9ZZZZ|nr:AAA domain-containing protein [Actinomycetota bacterium]
MTPTVILIGPPGAGKTSVGRNLARLMRVEFNDTDTLIEAKEKMSISDIFVDKGEPFFREIEKEVLRDSMRDCTGVLSLGGGAVLSEESQALLRSSSSSIIFLDVSLASAAPRIGFNRDRPLLLGNPRAQWQDLMNKRRPIYESLATHTLLTDQSNPAQTAEAIVKIIK